MTIVNDSHDNRGLETYFFSYGIHPWQASLREENFLTFEDADNLQDMINFVASMNQSEKSQTKVLPIESLYDQVAYSNYTNSYSNVNLTREQIESAIEENLKR